VQRVLSSPDGRKLAALSQDWRIAIWDLTTGGLDAILSAPKGYSADNAALAFSADGLQLAACAGREARLWDLASGKMLRVWQLPPGLLDQVAFPSTRQLLVLRFESRSGVHVPIGDDRKIDPIVCRIRNLLGAEPLKPAVEFRGFDHGQYAMAVPGSPVFMTDLWHDRPDSRYEELQALDGLTGKVLWSQRWEHKEAGGLEIDPTGRLVALGPRYEPSQKATLCDAELPVTRSLSVFNVLLESTKMPPPNCDALSSTVVLTKFA
jgi:hypothetical protein